MGAGAHLLRRAVANESAFIEPVVTGWSRSYAAGSLGKPQGNQVSPGVATPNISALVERSTEWDIGDAGDGVNVPSAQRSDSRGDGERRE